MRQAIGARVAGALLFAFCAAVAGSVLAEQIPTPAPTPENTGPAPQVQRQVEQPLNSAPVWREVRSGGPAVTTVRGRETHVLRQRPDTGAGHPLDDASRIVGRGVVHHDRFDRHSALGQRGTHRQAQVPLVVVRDHDDGDIDHGGSR